MSTESSVSATSTCPLAAALPEAREQVIGAYVATGKDPGRCAHAGLRHAAPRTEIDLAVIGTAHLVLVDGSAAALDPRGISRAPRDQKVQQP
jgi:hypothetical protein